MAGSDSPNGILAHDNILRPDGVLLLPGQLLRFLYVLETCALWFASCSTVHRRRGIHWGNCISGLLVSRELPPLGRSTRIPLPDGDIEGRVLVLCWRSVGHDLDVDGRLGAGEAVLLCVLIYGTSSTWTKRGSKDSDKMTITLFHLAMCTIFLCFTYILDRCSQLSGLGDRYVLIPMPRCGRSSFCRTTWKTPATVSSEGWESRTTLVAMGALCNITRSRLLLV